ncbi:MAG: TIR domain-containing protein [Nevskia sp.]|nr:TIR domain-containing protein [Nevskia sp.]
MNAAVFKYPGFISYSHRDRKVAEWLHRAIERYRVPARLVGSAGAHGPVPARLYPIFRDRDELAAGPLADQLIEAIAQSRCFVLICSPQSAASRWVNDEVTAFLQQGQPSRLLCLIADGEPNAADPARECLPPVLRERGIEPLAAGLHDDADGRDHARLKIIAGLLGVGFDELKRRDLVARNRRLIAVAALSLAVSVLTAALALVALRARDEAERSRQQGEELIGFMLGELRGQLEPLGKLGILDAVGDRAMAYFAGLDRGRDPGPRALAARAKALRQIGEVRFAQGRPGEAVVTLTAARELQRDLVARTPASSALLFELGQIEYWVGYAAWRAGDFDGAETGFRAYRQIAETLVEREPGNREWRTEVAYALSNLGVLAHERKRHAEALPLFQQSMAVVETLLQEGPLPTEVNASLLTALSWQGSTLAALGQRNEGLAVLGEHARRHRALLAQAPDDHRLLEAFCNALSTYGIAAIEAGQPTLALAIADEGLQRIEVLIATDADNLDYQVDRAYLTQVEASARYQLRHWDAARAGLAGADAALTSVLQRDPALNLARVSLLSVWDLRYALAFRDGDAVQAHRIARDALQIADGTPTDSLYAPLIRASAHLMALELALYVDRDAAATAQHRDAASSALSAIDEKAPEMGRRGSRLQALLGLMNGTDHIADAALPDNAAPWAYSVVSFIERRCPITVQPVQAAVPTLDCIRLKALAKQDRGLD